MNQTPEKKSTKSTVVIICSIIVGLILVIVIRAVCINAAVDHAYDRAEEEYNKAYDKAQRDMEKAQRDIERSLNSYSY